MAISRESSRLSLNKNSACVSGDVTRVNHLGRTAVRSPAEPAKYDYIDALRGYAVLLVIVVHVGAAFPELPWPVKRFTNLGWYGVQLFFVVSSMTLAMSWFSRQGQESMRSTKFFVRRFLRIAPMYYVATVYYLIVRPPGEEFSVLQLLASSTFVHGWSPGLLPTSNDHWTVVPGSWSVAAEFGFYFLFPVLISMVSTPRRAVIALAISLCAAFAANEVGFALYLESYGFVATDQLLFFWLPTQMPIFLSGLLLFHLLRRARASTSGRTIEFLHRRANWIIGAAAVAFLSVPFLSIPRLPLVGFPFVPIHVLVSWVFCVAIAVLSVSRRHFLVNKPAVWMGRVSFSAYLIHFTVIPTLATTWPGVFNTGASDVPAIAHFVALQLTATVVTFLVSFVTYKTVELPMIALGKRLCGRFGTTTSLGRPHAGRAAIGM